MDFAKTSAVVLICSCAGGISQAQVRWSADENGDIYIQTSEATDIGVVEFRASGPYLTGGDSTFPFSFAIAGLNEANTDLVIFGFLSTAVRVDGTLALDINVDRDFIHEISATWGGNSGIPSGLSLPLIPSSPPPPKASVFASWPSGGGPITLTAPEPLNVYQVALHTRPGIDSQPFTTGTSPDPFGRYLTSANRSNLSFTGVRFGPVLIDDGGLTLDLSVAPGFQPDDGFGVWAGEDKVGTIEFIPEPTTELLAIVAMGFLTGRRDRRAV